MFVHPLILALLKALMARHWWISWTNSHAPSRLIPVRIYALIVLQSQPENDDLRKLFIIKLRLWNPCIISHVFHCGGAQMVLGPVWAGTAFRLMGFACTLTALLAFSWVWGAVLSHLLLFLCSSLLSAPPVLPVCAALCGLHLYWG